MRPPAFRRFRLMRITLLNQFYRPDLAPTASLAASLAEHLAQAGHTVTIVTSRGGYVAAPVNESADQKGPVRVVRLWTPRLGKAAIWKRLADYLAYYLLAAGTLLRLPRQDVLVSLTTPPFIVLAALLHRWRHRDARVVLWNMDCYPEAPERAGLLPAGGLVSRLLRALNRFIFRRVDEVVCLDSAMRELLESQYQGVPAFHSTIIPNWEPRSLFPRSVTTARAVAAPRDRLVVLYQGNAGVGHEFETVLECARLLRDVPVEFRFVGGGKWWSWLASQGRAHNLAGWSVEPYVPKEETPQLLAQADIALITLRESSLGVMSPSKLHSNLAAGLPVLYIGPQGSNVDEAITRYGCGLSLRNGDAAGAAEFLRALVGNPFRREKLSGKARQAFELAYCDAVTLPQFETLLLSLASQPPGAAVSPPPAARRAA